MSTENHIRYRATIECQSHITGTVGLLTVSDAFEYVSKMNYLTRADVISIKIERYVARPHITADTE
jgi:hypothetical protein